MGTIATTTSLDTLMPGVSFDTATTSLATTCINWAENQVRSKLSRRYDVSNLPFTVSTSTSMLTSITEKLAMGYLYKQISRGSKESIERGESLQSEANEALMQLANYECDLLGATNGTAVVSDRSDRVEVVSSSSAYHTTFDEDDPLNWKIDDDKLSDIDTGRT